ncbi:hypothetical protein ACS0TY_021816 [Phlomoides rotata]
MSGFFLRILHFFRSSSEQEKGDEGGDVIGSTVYDLASWAVGDKQRASRTCGDGLRLGTIEMGKDRRFCEGRIEIK